MRHLIFYNINEIRKELKIMNNSKSLLEDTHITPFLKKLTVFCSGGSFLDGYILVIIGAALVQLGPQLHLNAYWTGLIGAVSILSILQMFITSPMEIVILRFLIGVAVGADYPIGTSLLAEFAPKKHRGTMLGILQVMWFIGASAVGTATAISRIGAFLGTFALPSVLDKLGIGITMLIMTGITAVGLILCIALAPETKGMSLAEAASVSPKN